MDEDLREPDAVASHRWRTLPLHSVNPTMNPQDAMQMAEGMGLTLPSPAWIFGCILFSLIGFAAWRYGKVVARPPIRWLGAALMFYSYLTSPTWLLYGVGVALCAAVWWVRRGAE